MKNKLNNRILSCIIAAAVAIASVPLSLFVTADQFIPENLLINGSLASVRAVGQFSTNPSQIENMTGNRISADGINDIINGKTNGYTYFMDALGWDPARYVGLEFTLNESQYIGEVIIDAGYESREEIYDIYAADSIGGLYSTASKVAESVSCLEGVSKVTINKSAKYVAVICTSCIDGGMRIKQIKVMSGEAPIEFKAENILLKENALVTAKAIAMLPTDSTQIDDVTGNRITADGINDIINGKTDGYTYFMDALGWDPPKYVGLTFGFDTAYYVGEVVIDAGYESREEIYDIYVSDSETTLYSQTSKVVTDITCLDGAATVPINKSAKYMAIVCTSSIDGGMRIKQIRVMTGETEAEFVSENLLIKEDALVNSKAITMLTTDISQVEDATGNRVSADGITDIINGTGSYTYVMDALGWSPPKYVGLTFTFDTSYYIGDVTIDAGYEGLEEIYDIYVADSESTLYSEASRVATGVTCLDGAATATINKSAKYISFVCTSCKSGGMRIKQIVVMSAQPDTSEDTPPEEDEETVYDTSVAEGGKKVLTIGNSFSENAAQYATEIAADQGYDLLFGYLKYPSATIEQHISNAQKNSAVYKFEYTSSKGRFTVKDGESSFASVKDALEFTDWDIVVLQQGSTASEDFNTYLNISKLVDYVKSICPDAEIMLHETWSWGIWNENGDERCYKIMANYLAASQFLCDDATVIHSGLAIEKVREHYGAHLMLNDEDGGNYQHLNALGKYIAGAVYVATIFGCDITANTYGDGEDAFAALDLGVVCSIIADAVSNGDDQIAELYEEYLAELYDKLYGEPDNFISRHLSSAQGVVQDVTNGVVDVNDRFGAAVTASGSSLTAAQLAIDGDTVTTFDVWGALDWDPPKNVGVKYTLDGVYKVDTAVIYAGSAADTVTIDVYAAKSGDALFDEAYLVGDGIVCNGEKITIDIGEEISEVAFIITNYSNEGNTAHIAEFDLTGSDEKVEDNEVVNPEDSDGSTDNEEKGDNFISRHFGLSEDIVYDIETGAVDANDRFNSAVAASGNSLTAAQLAIDGDTVTTFDVWGALDWDPPKNVGVKYVLDGVYKVDTAEIYAGNSSNTVTVDVYAARSGETSLYDEANLVGKGIVCNGEKVTVDIGAEISEVAFIITDYNKEGNTAQIAEFDLTGSDEMLSENEAIQPDGSRESQEKGDNFIARHLDSFSGIVQDLETGAVDANDRFGAAVTANGSTVSAEELAIDGDTDTTFDVWGAHDWDPPKNVGVRYALDAIYKVDTAVIYAGNSSNKVTIDVYAAKVGGPSLYQEANLVGKGIVCNGEKVTVDIGTEITEVAFIITDYNTEGNTAHIAEFDLTGSDNEIPKEEFKWPEVPAGENILKNATAYEIIAPGGDYRSSKEYDYGFMDYKTETELSKLVDGNTEQHYDIWSLRDGDKPGVLYDLGAYYDVSHVHAWAGVFQSDLYTVNGYRIYASDTLSTLYQDENALLIHENEADTTNEAAADVDVKKVRYIAFIITEENGGWKLRELAAYGVKSADQSQPAERESIIAGLDAEYYGVATDNLYDPIYMGASDDVTALVDGKRENVEFWGGNDVNNSCFVFIYNLYANYDLSDVEIFANADYMDTEFNVHKGIKSAKVYASRKFDGLFSTTPIVLKDGYANDNQADEVSSFTADALSDWKAARYVAFVFTIDDTQYGACRLEELKVYGTMSAVQDEEEKEARLPQYIDIEAENGVIARIFAMSATDDLSKLDAHLNSNRSTEEAQLNFINNALEGYNAAAIYSTSIVDSNGNTVDTDGRFIRLSLPKESDEHYVACVDDFGAEIVSNGVLNNYLTVETSTLRSYALVLQAGTSASTGTQSGIDWLWAAVISLGVLAVCGIGLSVLFGLKVRKS